MGDDLRDFDLFIALENVSTDPFPGANALHPRWSGLTRFIENMHPN